MSRRTEKAHQRNLERAERHLFVDRVCLLAGACDWSLEEVLSFLSRFTTDTARSLRLRVPLDFEERKAAEVGLCQLVERVVTRERRTRRRVTRASRGTDWGASAVLQMQGKPGVYVERLRREELDTRLYRPLVWLLERWLRQLELSERDDAHRKRADSLRRALSVLRNRGVASATPWNETAGRKLAHLDAGLARNVSFSLNYMRRIRGEALAKFLRNALLHQGDEPSFKHDTNRSIMLEVTFLISAAQAFREQPLFKGATLRAQVDDNRNLPKIEFEASGWVVRVSKGRPADTAEVPLFDSDEERPTDGLDELLQAAGHESTGLQPDLVVTLWKKDEPNRLWTILGDAKRNAEGSGRSYLAESIRKALVYRHVYGELLVTEGYAGQERALYESPTFPFTLLFQKAVVQCCGVRFVGPVERKRWFRHLSDAARDKAIKELCANLEGSRAAVPEVLCLDLNHLCDIWSEGPFSYDGRTLDAWAAYLLSRVDARCGWSAQQEPANAGQALGF